MLTLTVHNLGDMVILRCADRIVRGEETAISCAGAQQQGRNVILDLSGVDAIDAAGIGLLVSLQAAGIYLKLMNPTKQVREILRVTNLESVFEISESQSHDDYPAAVAFLQVGSIAFVTKVVTATRGTEDSGRLGRTVLGFLAILNGPNRPQSSRKPQWCSVQEWRQPESEASAVTAYVSEVTD